MKRDREQCAGRAACGWMEGMGATQNETDSTSTLTTVGQMQVGKMFTEHNSIEIINIRVGGEKT